MEDLKIKNSDPVTDPVQTPQGLPDDADPQPDQPTAPPPTPPDASAEPPAPRPPDPARANKLLKANRKGIGGPKTPAGKAASARNSLQHGAYSKMPFQIFIWEDEDEFHKLDAEFRADYQPLNATSALILELVIQAAWRLRRCNHAESLALRADPSLLDQYLNRLYGTERHRTTCERALYRHLQALEKILGDARTIQDATDKTVAREAARRFNEAGEEMHPDFPQTVIRKFSCDPESSINEVTEFDCTLAGVYSSKRTPLKDYKNGSLVGPHWMPANMKGEWPEHLLGPWAKNPVKK